MESHKQRLELKHGRAFHALGRERLVQTTITNVYCTSHELRTLDQPFQGAKLAPSSV